MIWRLNSETHHAGETAPGNMDGRFILHRHRDAMGPHLDLRLEHEGELRGWRIDSTEWPGYAYASDKLAHPIVWLERDGDAERVASGVYAWLEFGTADRRLVLYGDEHAWLVRATRIPSLPAGLVAELRAMLDCAGAPPEHGVRLIADGMSARTRAITRLCGLGRELDGNAFHTDLWKKMLEGLSLEEIHEQLHTWETRFDRAYPPLPVSRPETLAENESPGRASAALAIARD